MFLQNLVMIDARFFHDYDVIVDVLVQVVALRNGKAEVFMSLHIHHYDNYGLMIFVHA